MHRCESCGTLYVQLQDSRKCCAIDDKFIIPKDLTKQQFIEAMVQTQKQMGQQSLSKAVFEDMVSPQQVAQFMWLQMQKKKQMTEDQMMQSIQLHLAQIIITSLCNKGLLQASGVSRNGQICYKLTQLGKCGANILEDKQKKNVKIIMEYLKQHARKVDTKE